MRTRTICDLQGNRHTLELGTDYLLLDGRPCIFVEITHERIQLAHAEARQPISLATGEFWRDVVGDAPTPEDAGELYASYLAQWAAQQRTSAMSPIQSFTPAVSFDAGSLEEEETFSVGEAPSSTWFRWTQEREQVLADAITEHAGSLDQVNTTVIKEIARKLDWPWKSVEYKVSRMKRKREGHQDSTVKEDDRSSHKLRDLFRTAS